MKRSLRYSPSRVGLSWPVTTAFTPGKASALLVSIFLINACATGLWTIFPWSSPGPKAMSSTYFAAPVTFSNASTRGTLLPTGFEVWLVIFRTSRYVLNRFHNPRIPCTAT